MTSRCWGESFLESFSVLCRNFSGSTTAATTTGPASGPRPASSMPATIWQPPARRAFSKRRLHFMPLRRMATLRGLGNLRTRGALGGSGLELHLALAHGHRRLALEIAQVIELRAAGETRGLHVDLRDARGVDRENALDA